MPRNIHNPQQLSTGQFHVREAQFYRDAAALFFLESIGFDSGQRPDQRRFSMIDMPGGTENDLFHVEQNSPVMKINTKLT
jgi:hypothetical protein